MAIAAAGCRQAGDWDWPVLLTVLDLGQADSLLLETPDAVCLVDAGESDCAPEILRTLRHKGIDRLDLVVLTHPHSDHIGGFAEVARQVQVDLVLDSGFPGGNTAQRRALEVIQDKGIVYRRAIAGQKVILGDPATGVTLDVLWPPVDHIRGTSSDENNNSVVLMVQHGDVRILLTGDLQTEAESALLQRTADLRAHLLKVGHQGSNDASGAPFLSRVQPEFAVICVGEGNPYGHPMPEALQRLQDAGARVLRTDVDGQLVFGSDGKALDLVSAHRRDR